MIKYDETAYSHGAVKKAVRLRYDSLTSSSDET